MKDASIIPLQQLYLSLLVQVVNAEGLTAVQQDIASDTGRLWLVREGTTVPQAWVAYKFGLDDVALGIVTRDQRELSKVVKYAEGLDGFAEDLSKFLRANRLTVIKSKRAS